MTRTPSMTTEFVAFYEDFTKVEAAAKARGLEDGESFHDFVEVQQDRFRAAKKFTTLREAVSWLRAEVKAYKTVYGAGDVRLIEVVERSNRCRYCTCNGRRATEKWIVTDDGIEQHDMLDSPCLD